MDLVPEGEREDWAVALRYIGMTDEADLRYIGMTDEADRVIETGVLDMGEPD